MVSCPGPILSPQREYAFSTDTRPICPRCPLHLSFMFNPVTHTSQLFPQNSAATFITAFFAEYPEFDYDSTAPVTQEYRRLTQESDWAPRSRDEKKAKSAFGEAMGKQFASFYGSSIHDIKAWKALCKALNVYPIPETIAECRDVRTGVLPSPCCYVTVHNSSSNRHMSTWSTLLTLVLRATLLKSSKQRKNSENIH